jgi:hypothetical protein
MAFRKSRKLRRNLRRKSRRNYRGGAPLSDEQIKELKDAVLTNDIDKIVSVNTKLVKFLITQGYKYGEAQEIVTSSM